MNPILKIAAPDGGRHGREYLGRIDGHNIQEILDAIDKAKSIKGKPTIIIAHTVKGKGVSFMEGSLAFHGKAPSKEQCEKALYELDHRRLGEDNHEF